MVDLREFEFIELHWHQLSNWKKSYVLKFDEELVATLEYPSIWTSRANAVTSHGDWSIKLSGVFKPELTVRRKGSKQNIITAPINFQNSKIDITFPSRNNYEWKKINLMKGEYGWYYKDELISEFGFVITFDKKRVKTSFSKPNLPDDDLSLLLLIGGYLMFRIQQGSGV